MYTTTTATREQGLKAAAGAGMADYHANRCMRVLCALIVLCAFYALYVRMRYACLSKQISHKRVNRTSI